MKKISTLLVALLVLVAFANAQKNVAYMTLQKDMAEGAWPVDNDVIIQLLKADPKINLTVLVTNEDGAIGDSKTKVDLSGYDAIIAAETYNSGDNVWKSGYPLYMGTLPAPTLYNKAYSLRKDKALGADSPGQSHDAEDVYNMTVAVPTHPIFSGIDVSGEKITVVKSGVGDTGDKAYNKAMQYNTGNVVSGSTLLGYPEGATDVVLSFNDLAAGTTIDDITVPVRVISFAMNTGQLTYKGDDDSGINLTTDGLTLWRNAVYIVAGIDVPTTPAVFPSSTKEIASAKLKIYGVEGGIKLPENSNASVYSISGKLIQQGVNKDFISAAKGMYIVRVGNSASKVMVSK